MPKRSFTLPNVDDGEPVEFELVYKLTAKDGAVSEETESFTCLPQLPGDATRYLVIERSALACMGFVARCLTTKDDADRFFLLCGERDVLIRQEDLADVMEWLIEVYADRPTVPPSP